MATIVSVHPFKEAQVRAIEAAAPELTYIDVSSMEQAGARERLAQAEIILGFNRDVLKIVYSEGSSLKWIQNLGAGVDHIPLDRIKERGVTLTNASGVHPYQISESIFAMLLSLTRQVHAYVRNQQAGVWQGEPGMGEAHHKTIAILGVGAIGLETAKIAKAFSMNVLGIRKSGEPAEFVDHMYTMDKLHEVLAQSDYVINCLPLTSDTRHLIGKSEFAAMKRTACYINIGRGATTDTAALVDALHNGVIAGAGLDVFEQEPLPQDHPLWKLEQVIVTPHIAGDTALYMDRALDIILDNLAHYSKQGAPARNIVDLEAQY
ncbi:phosphoglycerate dehydrogenase-like enzyme [Paenibacillus taihuensis]|uniref:Phosphoglycerate dehydrogenase-like enzyme n=1 Tax=Paenibacillus taihuensis TaxID=1156355 RepID=A0A3D9SIH7_9BACL|nr:D-2-hydroxyacid dehydrogenase [Paenibacillus taihuensis]REE93090.1 phosphoglycerate dehydrogenase-like enzyme [Paenibacillus taihuensis]